MMSVTGLMLQMGRTSLAYMTGVDHIAIFYLLILVQSRRRAKMIKNFKFFVLLMLGFAMVFMIGLHFAPDNNVIAPTTEPTTATTELARYKHIPTVATIDRRQVVRGYDGVSLVTYSTDANGESWIDSINLTTNK